MATKKNRICIFKIRNVRTSPPPYSHTPNPPTHAFCQKQTLNSTSPCEKYGQIAGKALSARQLPHRQSKGEAAVAFRWWGIGS